MRLFNSLANGCPVILAMGPQKALEPVLHVCYIVHCDC